MGVSITSNQYSVDAVPASCQLLLTRQPAADSNESRVLQKAKGEADDIWDKISHNGWQNRAFRRIAAPETAAASSAKSKLKWSNANDLQHYHHTAGYKGGNCSCQFYDLKCPLFCESSFFFFFCSFSATGRFQLWNSGNLHIWIFPWCPRKAVFTHEVQTISGESFWDFCYSCLTHM